MFNRYTEKARRVIFFARYEASQYGSPYVESEHLLLGLLREDLALVSRFLERNKSLRDVRVEIERHITRRERTSTSVEVPLTDDCSKILNLALEESERLAHREVGTGHILIAMLGVEGSLAEQFLRDRGLKPEPIRDFLAKSPGPESAKTLPRPNNGASEVLNGFLGGLSWYDFEKLAPFFAQNTYFVDFMGQRWIGRDEIGKQFATLFASYAKKNVTFLLEGTHLGPAETVVASVLWEDVTGTEATKATHRMTVVLAQEGDDWVIFLMQTTPVISG